MNFGKLLLSVVAVGLASAALAEDDVKMTMAIAVVDDDGGNERNFKINSDDLGFDLQEMQEGENRSIVDESGKNILVTRTSDGFSFNIDGETIDLPALHGEGHHGMVWVGDGDASEVDVHVMHDTNVTMMHEMNDTMINNTMIISGKPIDAATQQAIRDLLGSSGYASEVSFIDRDAAHDGNVIIKKVERIVESPQT
jgi:hypothetical protein